MNTQTCVDTNGVSRGTACLKIPSRVAAKESRMEIVVFCRISAACGLFALFPCLAPQAVIFRLSVPGFRVHFQKLICAHAKPGGQRILDKLLCPQENNCRRNESSVRFQYNCYYAR
jgi:hypothetical protein